MKKLIKKIKIDQKDREEIHKLMTIALNSEVMRGTCVSIRQLLFTYFYIQSTGNTNGELDLLASYLSKITKRNMIRAAKVEIKKCRSVIYNVFLQYIVVFGGL